MYSGVRFLCWPLFDDQFLDKSYICDVWKVGLELDKDENGFISKEEIRKKVEQLLRDEGIRARSLELKEVTKSNLVKVANLQRILKSLSTGQSNNIMDDNLVVGFFFVVFLS